MMRNSSAISALLSAAVGSSMISTRESNDSAFAISTICCFATVSRPTGVRGSRSSRIRAKIAAASRFSLSSSTNTPKRPRGSRPMKMFCATLRWFIRFSS